MRKQPESTENKTFRIEGWLPVAFLLIILTVGFIAVLIVPYFVQ